MVASLTRAAPLTDTVLQVAGLTKRFGSTTALDEFSLALRAGEVHALLGGNGSGKSTFIKVLAGIHRADAGTLEVSGRTIEAAHTSPSLAREVGLRFVHQDLGIVPELSLTDNLALGEGYDQGRTGRIHWRASHRRTAEVLRRFHVDADPAATAATLSMPQRAMLVIARALQNLEEDQRGILVLDEPTAALPPEEATLLLEHIKRIAAEGHAVLLVTHRLDEVRQVANRITALRDGAFAGTEEASDLTESDMVQLILGRRLPMPPPLGKRAATRATVLSVRKLFGAQLAGVDLEVRPGEIVGIAGLLGSGRTELLELIYGLRRADGGEVSIGGVAIGDRCPRTSRAAGVELVPEDRGGAGVFPQQSVSENMTAGSLGRYLHKLRLDSQGLRRETTADLTTYRVKTTSVTASIDSLSGGNQQKVVLARCLRRSPKLLLLDEPTQGIDVGAREEIYGLIQRASEVGTGVLIVSSEFAELSRLCHRVLVLARGRVAAEHEHGISEHALLESVLVQLSQEGS